MKSLFRLFALLVLSGICVSAIAQENLSATTDKAALERVLTEYAKAVRTYDAKALDRLFDKEYVEVSPLGEIDDRAKTLSYYRVPADQRPPLPDSIAMEEIQTRFLTPNAAVVIAREAVAMTLGEKKVTMAFRATFVLHKTDGEWRLFSSQFVGLRPSPK